MNAENQHAKATRKLHRQLRLAAAEHPRLQELLGQLGYPESRARPPGFATLLQIIVSQQLSTGAARAIWQRLQRLCNGKVTPRKILNRDDDALRACGLSMQKINYARGLAELVIAKKTAAKRLDLDSLAAMESEAAIAKLCEVRGVGRWSAEIYLLFALQHPDIYPAGDLALQVAVQRYAGWSVRPSAAETAAFAERWAPYRGAVAVLMWRYYGAGTLE